LDVIPDIFQSRFNELRKRQIAPMPDQHTLADNPVSAARRGPLLLLGSPLIEQPAHEKSQ